MDPINILQLNLNHCEAAQELLSQTVREHRCDIAILSEQYKNISDHSWITDSTGTAAIWVCSQRSIQDSMVALDQGFVWVKVDDIHIYSCYAPRSMEYGDFLNFLDRLVNDARKRRKIVIAGDLNAQAIEWGSVKTNQ